MEKYHSNRYNGGEYKGGHEQLQTFPYLLLTYHRRKEKETKRKGLVKGERANSPVACRCDSTAPTDRWVVRLVQTKTDIGELRIIVYI